MKNISVNGVYEAVHEYNVLCFSGQLCFRFFFCIKF